MATGTELARAYVTLVPSMQGAQRQIERDLGNVDTARVGRDIGDGMGRHIGSSLKSLIGPAIALAGAVGVSKFVTDSVKSLSRIETINTQTATAIKSTGNSANVTAKEIEDLAGSLENMTATEAESIQKGANLLLTFKNIKNQAGEGNDIFNQTTVAMTDMARAMGTDAEAGAIQLGKALNDPTKGIAALTRVGITFSDEQKNMIASLQESGDMMGAQKIILAELQSQFGGSAAAYADTFQGRIDLLVHAFGTFGEAISTVVMPAIKSLAVVGADALNWAAELFTTDEYVAWGENVGASIANVTGGFSGMKTEFSGGLTAMKAAFNDGGDEITSSGFAGALETIGVIARNVWDAIGPTFSALAPQILTLVTTMSPLAIIFQSLQPVLPQLAAAIGSLAAAMGGVLAAILPTVVDLVGMLVDVLSGTLAEILPTIAKLLTTVGTVLADTLVALLPIIVPLIDILADAFVALMPLIGDLVEFVGGALSDILVAIMPIILQVATILGEVLGDAIDALLPIFPILVNIVISLLGALMPLVPAILQVVSALLPLVPVTLQLTTALLPVFLQLIELLLPVLTGLVTLLVSLLVPVVNLLAGAIEWLVGKITTAVTWFVDLAAKGGALNTALSLAWTGIKSAASTAWTWIKDNVFTPFGTAIDALGAAFNTVKDVIGTAWTAIQDAALAPVNFIIETVYTNGIKKLFDTVADKLGLDLALPVVNKIGAAGPAQAGRPVNVGMYASGGVLPGYTPGVDVHEFFSPTGGRLSLSGGEAIMRPEFTRAVGGAAGVARLNAAAIKGQAFAGGGVWGWVKDKLGDAWDFTSNAASAVGNFMKDPITGALEVISKPVMALLEGIGGGDIGSILAAAPKALLDGIVNSAKSIFGEPVPPDGTGAKAPAGAAMGYQAMIAAIQAARPGTRITSSFRPGAITAVGTASYHGKGRAIDMAPSMALFDYLSATYPGAAELLYSPAGARQIINGKRTNTSGVTNANHFDHVHWAMANGGVLPKVYDQGGWLPPGGMAINMGTRPEAILDPDQSDRYANGGLKDGDSLVLVVDGTPMRAYVHGVAEAAITDDKRARSGYRGRG